MKRLTGVLRNPKTIVAEVAVLTLLLALSTTAPQGGVTGETAAGAGTPLGLLRAGLSAVGLDHPFASPWFLVPLGMSVASLVLVLRNQVSRAWRLGRRSETVDGFGGAPFRREAVIPCDGCPTLPASSVRVRGRAGSWGSPIFHSGILLIVVAGILRLFFGADAVVDLMDGETLWPRPDQYGAQWPGLLAGPFAFPVPVLLESLTIDRYPSGMISRVEGNVKVGEGLRAESRRVAINRPLAMGSHTIYLRSIGGAAALVEADRGTGVVERHAILLRDFPGGASGRVTLADGTLLRLASSGGGIGVVPGAVDLRALREGGLAATAQMAPGEGVTLPEGTRIRLAGLVPWAQFAGTRDISTPVVYAGFAFALVGGLLMFTVVRVESAIVREAVNGGIRLTVLMRPQRFVPLFGPAFERLWEKSAEEVRRQSEAGSR